MSDQRPTMQEIDKREKQLRACVPATWMPALEPIFAAARRGVEADIPISAWKREELEWHDRHDKDRIRLGECESQRDAALQRAEKAEAELAALKVERDEAVRREPTAHAHLQALVTALDNAFISTWQSTAAWQKELDAANEYLLDAAQEGK